MIFHCVLLELDARESGSRETPLDVAKLICSAHALGWYASALISNIKLWPNLLDEFKGSHIVKKGNVVKDFMMGCATVTSKSYA